MKWFENDQIRTDAARSPNWESGIILNDEGAIIQAGAQQLPVWQDRETACEVVVFEMPLKLSIKPSIAVDAKSRRYDEC